jgi:hypothetical protein
MTESQRQGVVYTRKLAQWLKRISGRLYDGHRIVPGRADKHDKVQRWTLPHLRVGKRRPPSRNHSGRSPARSVCMSDWENLAGLMRLAIKVRFLPPGLQEFSRGTRMRSWVPFFITFSAGRINPAYFECRISRHARTETGPPP